MIETAKNVLKTNVNVQPGEKVAIIVDEVKRELGDIFFKAAQEIGAEAVLIQFHSSGISGAEPPAIVADAMKTCDAAICITEASISHTAARIEAAKANTRVATMPGLTPDMLTEGALTADYADVRETGEQLAVILDLGKEVTIRTAGHALTFSIEGRKSKASNGLLLNPGDSGNLPSGETFIAPIEGSANGTILIDGSIADIGKLSRPVLLKIKEGRLVDVEGEAGEKLISLLGDGDGRFVGEFGIGTNRAARLTGNILEDEKAYGTCHIAFGTNMSFGGTINAGVHLDAVSKTPEIFIDGQCIVAEGMIQLG